MKASRLLALCFGDFMATDSGFKVSDSGLSMWVVVKIMAPFLGYPK